jgi:hypothetical protein
MRPKLISDPLSVSKHPSGAGPPASAARIQGARDVDVHMPNCLIRRTPVVLPDGDSWSAICDVDRRRCFTVAIISSAASESVKSRIVFAR